jgi:hypothetical protein
MFFASDFKLRPVPQPVLPLGCEIVPYNGGNETKVSKASPPPVHVTICDPGFLTHSDGHGSPTGKFLPTRTHTHRIPDLFVRVRDSRAHRRGFKESCRYENTYGVGVQAWHECLADAHQTSIDVGAPATRVLHTEGC